MWCSTICRSRSIRCTAPISPSRGHCEHPHDWCSPRSSAASECPIRSRPWSVKGSAGTRTCPTPGIPPTRLASESCRATAAPATSGGSTSSPAMCSTRSTPTTKPTRSSWTSFGTPRCSTVSPSMSAPPWTAGSSISPPGRFARPGSTTTPRNSRASTNGSWADRIATATPCKPRPARLPRQLGTQPRLTFTLLGGVPRGAR